MIFRSVLGLLVLFMTHTMPQPTYRAHRKLPPFMNAAADIDAHQHRSGL